MRHLLFSVFLLFASTATFAQGDIADDLAALRQLVESQNRLLTEQSSQLSSLTQRVAELEGRSDAPDASSGGIFARETDPVPPQSPPQETIRTDAIEAGEIGLEQKESLRTGKETQIVDDPVVLSDTMDLYGSMRIFTEAGAGHPTLNDGSSRLGIRLGRRLANGKTLFGRVEWKINLVDNDSEFKSGDNQSGGGIVVRSEDTEKVFSTRLGYLGGSIKNIGEVTFGKQWSVYYDVAGWTDNFNVYGGAGLSVYSAGTDGGVLGSGRADNAIIWRSERGKVSYGLQTQLKTVDDNTDDYKGLGGSVIVSASDSWDIGLAFAGARVSGRFEQISGDDQSGVATLGARYHRGPWNAAINLATWKNHEAIFFEDGTLIYDGVGAELYAEYAYSDRLQLYGGINYTDPDIDDPRVDPDFGIEFLIFGASLFASEESFAYIEALFSNSTDENGEDVDSVISAGFRFDF